MKERGRRYASSVVSRVILRSFLLIITGGDLGTGEDNMLYGLAVFLVLVWLEEAVDGDAVALLQKVKVCGVLVTAPDLYIEDCAGALLVLTLALSADDGQAEAGYCSVLELVLNCVVANKTCH